jgi:hypothetical protein
MWDVQQLSNGRGSQKAQSYNLSEALLLLEGQQISGSL